MQNTLFDTGAPQTIAELVRTLTRLTDEGSAFLTALPVEAFFAAQGAKWSPAEHVRHLQKSAAPVRLALRLPRWILRPLFGTPRRPSRPFTQLRDDYRKVLAEGGQAGRFAPSPERRPGDAVERRAEILTAWQTTNASVVRALARWNETSLDGAYLPHPLLGKLTVREMAAFTVYHTVHHLTLVDERLSAGASKPQGRPLA